MSRFNTTLSSTGWGNQLLPRMTCGALLLATSTGVIGCGSDQESNWNATADSEESIDQVGPGGGTTSGNGANTGSGNLGVSPSSDATGVDPGSVGPDGTADTSPNVSPDVSPAPDKPVDTSVAACDALGGQTEAGTTKLRRLTRTQLNNTLRDLLAVNDEPAAGISPDASVGPFENNAFSPATDLIVEQYDEMANRAAANAVARMATLSSCDLAADATSDCATQFVTEFGQRAYRRPLTPEEVSAHVALFTLGRTEADAANGFRLVVSAMLQSPFFLYLWDVGEAESPQAGVVPVSTWELASRLSYFLWNSLPDDALFAAAANGTLAQDNVIDEQVERMLGDNKSAVSMRLFHLQWLKVYDLSRIEEKEPTLFPQFGAEFLTSMQAETGNFADYVIRRGDGMMSTLMSANWSIVDPMMASVYGVTASSNTEPTMLPADQRAGVLTQAAFLTRHAHRLDTSPTHRGITLRTNVLCDTINDPPPGVSTTLPDATTFTSTRERFAAHQADPNCAGCHLLIDPIGLSFEHYDAVGAWRETDQYGPVDATGEVFGGQGALAGTYNGAVELAQKLAASPDVAECLGNQWFRFALGRMESDLDACSVQALRSEFTASGYHVPTLIRSIIKSDAFRNVRSSSI